MTALHIRPFTPDDYPALADVSNACLEGELCPDTVDDLRHHDGRREPKYVFRRWLGEAAGRVVAFAEVFEPWFLFAPGRWYVEMGVHERFRGLGYGRAMAAHVEAFLAEQTRTIVFAGAVESSPGAGFAARRGFETMVREPLSSLDVSAFDFAPFAGVRERVAALGIQVSTGAEVLATVPDAMRRWWDLGWEIQQDIPFNRASARMPFEVFQQNFKAPSFDPSLWYLAHVGDDLVGVSGLKTTADPARLLTAVTGVARAHRRQGVATALKLYGIEAARSRGARRIKTDNEEDNPMLAINLRLGFVETDAWLCLERDDSARGA